MSPSQNKNDYYRYYPQTTRWHDNDLYGHVNNVVYYSYFDSSLNQYLIDECGLDIQADSVVGFVVASNCQYLKPIAYPGKIEIGFRVDRIGTKSVDYGLAVFAEGEQEASAFGSVTHVFVDRERGESIAIPENIKRGLERAML